MLENASTSLRNLMRVKKQPHRLEHLEDRNRCIDGTVSVLKQCDLTCSHNVDEDE